MEMNLLPLLSLAVPVQDSSAWSSDVLFSRFWNLS